MVRVYIARLVANDTTSRAICSRALLATLLAVALAGTSTVWAGDPKIRVAVLKFGTVNWELDVIQQHQLATHANIELEVVPLSSKSALNVALQGGAADLIVSDWIWVSRQRSEGRLYTFVPYSLAVGALMVRPDANIVTIADLENKRLGVAGGPVDKSWLLMRAYTRQQTGIDLTELVEPNFAAPPLLNQLMLSGELPAVINFWHYGARLSAAGMRTLVRVEAILPELGIEAPIPMLGWVFDEAWGDANADLVRAFISASYAAKKILAESDTEWERISPLTKAKDDVELSALRDGYRAGIPMTFGAAEKAAAAKAFALLAEEGGSELVGNQAELATGTFWPAFQLAP